MNRRIGATIAALALAAAGCGNGGGAHASRRVEAAIVRAYIRAAARGDRREVLALTAPGSRGTALVGFAAQRETLGGRLTIESLRVRGDIVATVLLARAPLKFAHGAELTRGRWTFHLTKASGRWLVDEDEWSFDRACFVLPEGTYPPSLRGGICPRGFARP